ncbi:MAG TPA: hypothetical protein VF806_06985 [Anaerolineaceae bacterium]
MNTKLLIVLLIVIIALFVIGVIIGGSKGSGVPSISAVETSVQRAAGGLSDGQRLQSGDIQFSNCPGGFSQGSFTLGGGGNCLMQIKPKSQTVRNLPLQLAPASANGFVTLQDADHTDTVSLDRSNPGQSDCAKIKVLEGGGNILLSCSGPAQCTLSIKQCQAP